MSLISRLRSRHTAARNARAIDRALRSAPTQAARDEILLVAQRYPR
jgi:hypothetical protein